LVRPVPMSPAGKSGSEMVARIWNKVADVPAGRRGVQVNLEGDVLTNPGQAMGRASDKGTVGQLAQALKTPPKAAIATPYQELQKTGTGLDTHLSRYNGTQLEFELPLQMSQKLAEALNAAKAVPKSLPLSEFEGGTISVTPLEARKLMSEIGNRTN